MIVVHGLKNCDTCRKAMKWLEGEGMEARLHDVRADGLEPGQLDRWIAAAGWETLLNRRGTTWRKLSEVEKDGVGAPEARALMLEHPALIKRPVFEAGGGIVVGFTDAARETLKNA